ncbi:MAG: HEAT repeat domain-containing protein [Anaerolineae bacterium]|nr:HEAT repeat domain-containing protein [Anaerolineae bacterium]
MEDLIASLKSSDVQRRRTAIIALGKSKNSAALKPLGEVYKNDPDPELRQLALEAGKYIRQHASQPPSSPPPSPSGSTSPFISSPPRPASQPPPFITEDEPPTASFGSDASLGLGYEIVESKTPNPRFGSTINLEGEVSERDVARARTYLDRAMSLHMSKNPGKAMEVLVKAIQLNPALKRDAVAQGLAAALTHQPPETAFEFLLNPTASQNYIKERQRETRNERSEGSLTENLTAVALDLATMTLVITLGFVILFVLFVRALNDDGNVFEFDPNNPDSVWNDSTNPYGGYSDFERDFYNDMCADYFNNPQLQTSDPDSFCSEYVNQQRVNQAVTSSYAENLKIDELRTVGVGISVVMGLMFGVVLAVSLIIHMTSIHYVATILGGGVGSLSGLMKRMVPYLTIVIGLIFAGYAIALFDGTATTLGLIYFGWSALFLINLFAPVYIVMKSYKFGFINGCGSCCLGVIVAGFMTSICQGMVLAVLGQILGSAA